VPTFQANAAVQGYAVEVSHHVITKTMGMPIERPENLMVYFPQAAAGSWWRRRITWRSKAPCSMRMCCSMRSN